VSTDRDKTATAFASPPLDVEVYRDLTALLGADKIDPLLVRLEGQLAAGFAGVDPRSVDRAKLANEAHRLVSQCGMLGFLELAEICRELEIVCLATGDIALLIERARSARDRAVQEIGRLKGAPRRSAA
jgi:HPt (histidine-containing phosphotransfer) domain-containing protein